MIDVGGPDHSGSIMGISNSIATLTGILGNMITGYFLQHQSQATSEEKGKENWIAVFHLASAISAIGGFVFLLGATDRNLFDTSYLRKRADNKACDDLDYK